MLSVFIITENYISKVAFLHGCTKGLLVNFKSSLLLRIIYTRKNITTIYKHIYIKYKQIYEHESYSNTYLPTDTKLFKMPCSLKL